MHIFKKLNLSKKPTHIAFIIDGNGRWAKKRGFPRTVGHSYGVSAVEATIKNCIDLDIKYMSFYTFSTENWKRPKKEVDEIFNLLEKYLDRALNSKKEYDSEVKVVVSGDIKKLPTKLQNKLLKVIEKTKNNKKFIVNIALNYGGRSEIIKAVNEIIKTGKKSVNEEEFKKYLYTKDMPDPDFVIRTSGELRTSNFMPYQTAYSEWYFPKVFWPDFDKKQLIKALKNYAKRNRRFGAIKKEEKV